MAGPLASPSTLSCSFDFLQEPIKVCPIKTHNVLIFLSWLYEIGCEYFAVTLYTYIPGRSSGHDDVIKWKHFRRYWPFLRGIQWWPVDSLQCHGTLMFSLIYAWTNGWANNCDACGLRRHRAHYGDTVITPGKTITASWHENIFRVTGSLWVEYIGHQWIPRKVGIAVLFYLKYTWTNVWTYSGVARNLRRRDANVTSLELQQSRMKLSTCIL